MTITNFTFTTHATGNTIAAADGDTVYAAIQAVTGQLIADNARTPLLPVSFAGNNLIPDTTLTNSLIYIDASGNVNVLSKTAFDNNVTAAATSATNSASSASASAASAVSASDSAVAAAASAAIVAPFTSQTGISAAGTSQGSATLLSTTDNFTLFEVTTVAAGTGVRLPPSSQTMRVIIANRGANSLLVYPYSGSGGGQMDGGNSITVQPSQTVLLAAKNNTQYWYSTLPGNAFYNDVSISASNPTLTINTASAGQSTNVVMATNGNYRWKISKNTDSESGSNAGSNLVINNYSDTGSYIGEALRIVRSSGNVTLSNQLTVNGACSFNGVAHDVKSVDGVGSIRLLYYVGSTVVSGGSTSGGALYTLYMNTGGTLSTGIAVSGTWKNITGRACDTTEACYFLRIA